MLKADAFLNGKFWEGNALPETLLSTMDVPVVAGRALRGSSPSITHTRMHIDLDQLEVRHNQAAHRFEVMAGGYLSVAEYRRDGQRILFTHTEVPPALRGHGIAAKLVRVALDYAREAGLTVVPLCWYVDAFIRRNPEYRDLLR